METPTDAGYPSTVATHGISCEPCHKIASVNVENINYPGIFPGARHTLPGGRSTLHGGRSTLHG